MSQTITITACDNELYLVAFNSGGTYQLAHIQSGNREPVSVVVTVTQGTYQQPVTYNGVSSPLNVSYPVSLPGDNYSLAAIGINWLQYGNPWAFAFTYAGVNYGGGQEDGEPGVVWTPSVVPMTV